MFLKITCNKEKPARPLLYSIINPLRTNGESNYVIKYAHAIKPISCPRRRRFTSGVRHVEKENGRVFLLC